MRIPVIVAVAAVSIVACTKVESSSIKTAGMSAQFSITADGSGKSFAVAALFVDDNITDRVDLSAGDVLSASAAGQTATLQRQNVLSILTYDGTLSVDAPGTVFTIAFTRANDTSAPNSTCTLPDAFTPVAPTGAKSRASDDVVITYAPSGSSDSMAWKATGDCIAAQSIQAIAGDPGTFTIPKGTLQSASMMAGTCNLAIQITRTRNGKLDPAYGHGGTITAIQSRSITFSSTP
jgi:hypothetical protein